MSLLRALRIWRIPRKKWVILLSLTGFFVWTCLSVWKLFQIQHFNRDHFRKSPKINKYITKTAPARRGRILDCQGTVLADNAFGGSFAVDPVAMKEEGTEPLLALVQRVMDWHPKRLEALKRQLAVARKKKDRYVLISDRLSTDQAIRLHHFQLEANHHQATSEQKSLARCLDIRFRFDRTYPAPYLASQVLGFVSKSNRKISEGLEKRYDRWLSGEDGAYLMEVDAFRNQVDEPLHWAKPLLHGADISLTLDARIQTIAEIALDRGSKLNRPQAISCAVIDPQNGDILALANWPDFDPEHYGKVSDLGVHRNTAVETTYEPASAMKIITLAIALEEGRARMDEHIFCENGGIQVADRFIHDHKKFGLLSVTEIIANSSNVGAIKLAQRVDAPHFYHYLQQLGFGHKLQVDLPALAESSLAPVARWNKNTQAYLAIGHELTASVLHMLTAASVIANGGTWIEPHIGARVFPKEGPQNLFFPRPKKRIFSKATCDAVKGTMLAAVTAGTATDAQVPGLEVFGKTGTAQRLVGNTYTKERFNASFVGFFPYPEPRYGIIVVVYDPKGKLKHGGDVAAPIFAEIAQGIATLDPALQPREKTLMLSPKPAPPLPEDTLVQYNPVPKGRAPELRGLSLRQALMLCDEHDIHLSSKGSGRIIHQDPKPGAPLSGKNTIELTLGN